MVVYVFICIYLIIMNTNGWIKKYLDFYDSKNEGENFLYDWKIVSTFLDELLAHSPLAHFIINFREMKLEYASPSFKNILGNDFELFYAQDPSLSMQRMHPDYQPAFVGKIVPHIREVLKPLNETERKSIQFSYNFQIKINNEYIHLRQDMRVLLATPEGIPLYASACVYDMSEINYQNMVHYKVKRYTENRCETIYSKIFHLYSNDIAFTKTEQTIFELIKKGRSTKDIADKLCISEETVKKHRKNMVRKAGVKNLNEMFY